MWVWRFLIFLTRGEGGVGQFLIFGWHYLWTAPNGNTLYEGDSVESKWTDNNIQVCYDLQLPATDLTVCNYLQLLWKMPNVLIVCNCLDIYYFTKWKSTTVLTVINCLITHGLGDIGPLTMFKVFQFCLWICFRISIKWP